MSGWFDRISKEHGEWWESNSDMDSSLSCLISETINKTASTVSVEGKIHSDCGGTPPWTGNITASLTSDTVSMDGDNTINRTNDVDGLFCDTMNNIDRLTHTRSNLLYIMSNSSNTDSNFSLDTAETCDLQCETVIFNAAPVKTQNKDILSSLSIKSSNDLTSATATETTDTVNNFNVNLIFAYPNEVLWGIRHVTARCPRVEPQLEIENDTAGEIVIADTDILGDTYLKNENNVQDINNDNWELRQKRPDFKDGILQNRQACREAHEAYFAQDKATVD